MTYVGRAGAVIRRQLSPMHFAREGGAKRMVA
jgi:hypothetical protein